MAFLGNMCSVHASTVVWLFQFSFSGDDEVYEAEGFFVMKGKFCSSLCGM